MSISKKIPAEINLGKPMNYYFAPAVSNCANISPVVPYSLHLVLQLLILRMIVLSGEPCLPVCWLLVAS